MKTLLILLILSLILSPDFQIVQGLSVLRLDDLIVLFFVVFSLLQKMRTNKSMFSLDRRVGPLLVIGFVALFSISFQEIFFDRTVVINDIMIFPMLLKYLLIYQMGKMAGDEKSIMSYLNIYLVVGLISVVVGIMQYHNIAGVNNWLSPIYIKDDIKIQSLIDQRLMARASGTIGDPRQYGYLLVTLLAILVTFILEKRKRLFALIGAAVTLTALIYTLSRTAVLVVIIIVAFLIFFNVTYYKSLGNAVKYSVIVFGAALFTYTYFGTTGFEERVLDTDSVSFESSRYARIRDLRTPIEDVLDNPQYLLFGKGPSKAYWRSSAHSDYGLMLDRFGIIAVAAYLILLWRNLSASVKIAKSARNPDQRIGSMILAAMVLTWCTYSFAEDIFRNSQLMPINMLMLGFLAALINTKSKSAIADYRSKRLIKKSNTQT